MPTVSTSVVVPLPADEIFDFLADARNLALWSSGVADVDPQAVRPAENAEFRYRFPGRHRPHRLVCASYEPCRRVVFRGCRMWNPLGTQVPEYGFRLLPLSQGTLVHLVVRCSLGGGLLLFTPVVSMAWRRDLPDDAARLREVLCGRPVETVPAVHPDPAPAPAPVVPPAPSPALSPARPSGTAQNPAPSAAAARAAVDGIGLAAARTPWTVRAGMST
jgi:uncharacterized protein YndB with AHSA1/START domain